MRSLLFSLFATTPKHLNADLRCACGYICESSRDQRAHNRICNVRVRMSETKSVRKSSVSSEIEGCPVLVPRDCQSPPGEINLDKHHNADARDRHCFFAHGEGKKAPEQLSTQRRRLNYPATKAQWEELDADLRLALRSAMPRQAFMNMTAQTAITKLETFLWKFIDEKVPDQPLEQDRSAMSDSSMEETPKANTFKSRAVKRLEALLAKNRSLKKSHMRYVNDLKHQDLFVGRLAVQVSKAYRKLLRRGARLSRRLRFARQAAKQRWANKQFRRNPHGFAKKLFSPPASERTYPDEQKCNEYFPDLYMDPNRHHLFEPMERMVRPEAPRHNFHLGAPSLEDLKMVVHKKRNGSSPGRDGIGYIAYKRLPSALEYLHLVMLKAWKGDIPTSWAEAAVVLLHKDGDPAEPKNYRPIALTSCSGKIFFSIWARRLEIFMQKNDYFKRSKQKGFLKGISGCPEHIECLKAALKDAKTSGRQIVVTWIDLKNAFGSVSHNLIQFALHWYHVPKQLAQIINTYYDTLVAAIEAPTWTSKSFSYEIGVFQGCVISPILFNMSFNLLLDLLSPLTPSHGYALKSTKVMVHDLSYADDLTIVTSAPKFNQASLSVVDEFLRWSRTMAAKPAKCKSLAFKKWRPGDPFEPLVEKSFAPFDPNLTISDEPVGFIGYDHFKFLGWKVNHELSEKDQKEDIELTLRRLLETVDASFVHGFMKLWLYNHYIVLKLAWHLYVYDLNVSWVKLRLVPLANRYLKKWAGLYKRSIVSVLYRPKEQYGLGLQSLLVFYMKLQVNKAFLLKYSKDRVLNDIYSALLKRQSEMKRVWHAAPFLESIEQHVDFRTAFAGQTDRRGLGSVEKRYVKSPSISERKGLVQEHLLQLMHDTWTVQDADKVVQGAYLKFGKTIPFDLSWTHLIYSKNPRLIRFVLNASTNSVVTPYLRSLWDPSVPSQCPLCNHPSAGLTHILAECKTALKDERYTWRHDSVLYNIEFFLREHLRKHNESPAEKVETEKLISFVPARKNAKDSELPQEAIKASPPNSLAAARDWQMLVDYTKSPICFPVHICVTDQRPDIILWSDSARKVILIELTCPLEENISDAFYRKQSRYALLKDQIQTPDDLSDVSWECKVWPIEVGARGHVAQSASRALHSLGFSRTRANVVLRTLAQAAARASFAIWKHRHTREWEWFPLIKLM